MEKPQALKVMGIILIVLGIIRLLSGVIGIFAYLKMGMENINLLIVIFLENFVCTIIFIISGILLLKGKKTGIIFGFRGKNQLPLFMIIKEYFDENGEVDFAKVLFEIEGKKCKEEYKKIFEKEG